MATKKQSFKKIAWLAFFCLVIYILVKSETLYQFIISCLHWGERIITTHPLLGMAVFVMLSALAAMLAFFSTAILVPIGVQAWGMEYCLLLLWSGWWVGGFISYCIGYFAGNNILHKIVSEDKYRSLADLIQQRTGFAHILLFQAVLPSELPGLILGTIRYRISVYLLALAIVELPYAFATIYLSESFIQRDLKHLMIIGAGLIVFIALLHTLFHRLYDTKG